MRKPFSMEEYLAGRMVREPLGMFDMDLPVDGADAFILTSAERAKDLARPPVLINAAIQGLCETASDEDQLRSLNYHGQDVVVRQLWERSSRTLADIDLAYIYEGFTFIALSWFEKLGFCGKGEAGSFVESHWDASDDRIVLPRGVPVNRNGGMLSEGGSQGAGFVRDAVMQLRGEAGERQVPDASTALLAVGGFFYNSQALMLVRP